MQANPALIFSRYRQIDPHFNTYSLKDCVMICKYQDLDPRNHAIQKASGNFASLKMYPDIHTGPPVPLPSKSM